jgi:hypothetical protein
LTAALQESFQQLARPWVRGGLEQQMSLFDEAVYGRSLGRGLGERDRFDGKRGDAVGETIDEAADLSGGNARFT